MGTIAGEYPPGACFGTVADAAHSSKTPNQPLQQTPAAR